MIEFKRTYLEGESAAGPSGKLRRKGKAICPDGKVRKVKAGIPDTYFSIPAVTKAGNVKIKGYLMITDGELHFYANKHD